jgi:hypothetical protein
MGYVVTTFALQAVFHFKDHPVRPSDPKSAARQPETGGCMALRLRFTAALVGVAAIYLVASACGGNKNPIEPTPPPSTCTYTLSAAVVQADAAGQSISVRIETAAACTWTARAAASWVTLSPTSGSGPADIVMTVAANDATVERSMTVTIADRELTLRQRAKAAPSCAYALESGSSTFGPEGGRGRVSVKTEGGCAWTARSESPWITLRVSSGIGPGEIEYDVAPYDGTAQRQTAITVEGASFPVRQDPPPPASCSYNVDPTSTSLHWHGSVGDGFETRLTTGANCSWTAAPGASWIELLTPASGSGSAAMRVRINAYTGQTTRQAPLEIRWPAATAGQNVWITQEGCYYAISLTSDNVPAAGGRRRVSVFGTPVTVNCSIGCPWTVAANAPWIHIPGSTSRAGDDDVFFDVDPNTTGAPRTGTLTIAGRVLTVVQGS